MWRKTARNDFSRNTTDNRVNLYTSSDPVNIFEEVMNRERQRTENIYPRLHIYTTVGLPMLSESSFESRDSGSMKDLPF